MDKPAPREREADERPDLPAMEKVPAYLSDDFADETTERIDTRERAALLEDELTERINTHERVALIHDELTDRISTHERAALLHEEPTERINTHERAALLDDQAQVSATTAPESSGLVFARDLQHQLPEMEELPGDLDTDFADEQTVRAHTRERPAPSSDEPPASLSTSGVFARAATVPEPLSHERPGASAHGPRPGGGLAAEEDSGLWLERSPSHHNEAGSESAERRVLEPTQIITLVAHPSLTEAEDQPTLDLPLRSEMPTPVAEYHSLDRGGGATQTVEPPPPAAGDRARSAFEDPFLDEAGADDVTDRWSMPGVSFGRYRLLSHLKAGGMGEVFQAVTALGACAQRPVAIKRLLLPLAERNEFVSMFVDEARIMVQLDHPAIVQVLEFGVAGDEYFIAMEYVHGRDLDSLIRALRARGRPCPVAIATYIVQQVLEGLDHAHRRRNEDGSPAGIVHRDVSPPNILCGYDGQVKLTDFGVAKAAGRSSMTKPGQLPGRLCYMSPEQVLEQPVDHRSDLFAAGAVLHELLSGRRLFDSGAEYTVMQQVLTQQIPDLSQLRPEVPAALSQTVQTALERVPARRFQWASEMSAALSQVMEGYTKLRADRELARMMVELFGGEPAGQSLSPE